MGTPVIPRKETSKELMAETGRRRSKRVLLSIPILVTGIADGQEFKEETRTMVVNAHGALISLNTQVAASQLVTVTNKSTREARDCRIVRFEKPQGGKGQTAIEFLAPAPAFWQIDFPPDDWVVPEN